MSRATGRHTRPKKLNAKQNVQIFREEQVELIDYDATRGIIETGVEKNEESVSLNASNRPITASLLLSHACFLGVASTKAEPSPLTRATMS